METVYHGSPVGGLSKITPHVSTHGIGYVYATGDIGLATLFTQRWNDFIFNVSYGDGHVLEITERYDGALWQIYKGKGGFIYLLDARGFAGNATRFDGEVVCRQTQAVLGCHPVENIYERLLQMQEMGALRIYRYPARPGYIPADDCDLVDLAVEIFRSTGNLDAVHYCIRKHPGLESRLMQRLPPAT